eukprot:4899801-Alexandrium_andersonii.AAC.1
MASFLGAPSGSGTPSKKSSAPGVSDWNADLSDGDESTYTFRAPYSDNASQASTHASRATSTSEW